MSKFILAIVLGFIYGGFANAASNVTVKVDGEDYTCTKGTASGSTCDCRVSGGYTNFYINNTEVTYWSGTSGSQMVACVTHLKGQSLCSGSRVSCNCKASGSYINFYVNDVEVTYWSGTSGSQMMACAEYLNKQSYCN